MAHDGGDLHAVLLNASTDAANGPAAPVVGSDAAWRREVAGAAAEEPVLSPGFGALAANGAADMSAKQQRQSAVGSANGAGSTSMFAQCQRAGSWLALNRGFAFFVVALALVQGAVLLWAMRFPVLVCTAEITDVCSTATSPVPHARFSLAPPR